MSDKQEVTQVETPTAPLPGSPEYDAAMVARWRASQGPTQEQNTPSPQSDNKPTRPEYIPEKFWDAEKGEARLSDVFKSLTELEGKLTKSNQEAKTEQTPADGGEADPAKAVVEGAGLDWTAIQAKVVKDGKLEETDYAALAKAGVPKEMVDDYLDARRYMVEAETAKANAYVGGEKEMDGLINWAAANLTDAEKNTYNEMLASPRWKVAIDTLKTMRSQAKPTAGEPNNIGANAAGTPSAAGYQSVEEMKRDMRDPRYQTDPAFREQVAHKMQFASWKYDRR